MRLKNKKTGEIVDLYEGLIRDDGEHIIIKPVAVLEKCYIYNSLAELNAEWEDYEEPKKVYFIDSQGEIKEWSDSFRTEDWTKEKSVGNYFETEEEAEKAVEKLKAWKRLRDKGFRFIGKTYETDKRFGSIFYKVDDDTYSEDIVDDLDLLFGGKE